MRIDVIPIYRSLLPKATIITPNWFEVETITVTETKMEDRTSLQNALTILHETYSVPNRDVRPGAIPAVSLLSVQRELQQQQRAPVRYFSGVGDLFSALVLGHYFPSTSPPAPPDTSNPSLPPSSPPPSSARVLTPPRGPHDTDDELDEADPERRIRWMRGRELRLVQSRRILSGEAMGELRLLKEWDDFWGPD
ncbi:hypothetical protein BJV78DRAFT_1282531 [Lactifluus subvellereus]|nr:hypothetical protein BJV78DRAFT_1282531 [Lactifluus subvellereus]